MRDGGRMAQGRGGASGRSGGRSLTVAVRSGGPPLAWRARTAATLRLRSPRLRSPRPSSGQAGQAGQAETGRCNPSFALRARTDGRPARSPAATRLGGSLALPDGRHPSAALPSTALPSTKLGASGAGRAGGDRALQPVACAPGSYRRTAGTEPGRYTARQEPRPPGRPTRQWAVRPRAVAWARIGRAIDRLETGPTCRWPGIDKRARM